MAGPDNPAGGTAGPGGGHVGPPGQHGGGPGGTPSGPHSIGHPGPPSVGLQVPLGAGATAGEWVWNPVTVTDEGDNIVTEEVKSTAAEEESVIVEPDPNKFAVAFSEMKNLNANGVVFNKLLVWMDIQKDMIPPGT